MRFTSTRDPSVDVGFEEALFRGLAPDGGLYQPREVADLRGLFGSLPSTVSFVEIAARMVEALLPELSDPRGLAERAFPFAPVLSALPLHAETARVGRQGGPEPTPGAGPHAAESGRLALLELYHGPSCAFKDFGASFLATVMEQLLAKSGGETVILTATSGDTGSAVAQAFFRKRNIEVVVLYPSGRVSPLQEKQLATLGENVTALEVRGSFDDCQRMVKEAFLDPRLAGRVQLTSANSINLGRLIPQSFYYVWAWTRLREREGLYFCVPSGNFGNLTAGVLAWRWGLPIAGFIAATNRNDVVPHYLRTGEFTPRPSVQTYSNAMDVGNPSNFERLAALFGGDWAKIRGLIAEEVVTDEETIATIRRLYERSGRVIDPHTAVGCLAGERFLASHERAQVVTLATAHPGKFVEVVEGAIRVRPELPPALLRLAGLPKRSLLIENSSDALATFLLGRFG